ncbi:unnamed protein product [Caenorhabditis angaria]|uniref:mannose-6-phosphate isomerase n=1 Tax=Caenorhabditis angaria TaxID=860376 RepID=A0A9P1ILN9_9PELO|nr:unnamed protein product [Caenorhabditis angaria]
MKFLAIFSILSLQIDCQMLYKLQCPVNNYAWGAKGESSMAAILALAGNHISHIDPNKTYAEFWVGTHQNGPARVIELGKSLEEAIRENRELVGEKESEKLTFLFKVLSVAGPLSIQIHPTKAQGKILHSKDPKNYPDDNHKPEIAIALTEFELLSGFRQHSQISDFLKLYSEIQELLSDEDRVQIDNLGSFGESSSKALKIIFSRIWRSEKSKLGVVVEKLANRLAGQEIKSQLDELIVYLASLYPGDVGVFAPIFLNHFKLQPGEATFLEPNMPHAYLKGDCVECMSCSDNTIRAGLTPKYIDVESLVEMLNYSETLLPKYIPNELADHTKLFTPKGIDEFWVQEVKGSTGAKFDLPFAESASVLTVLSGSANVTSAETRKPETIKKGEVLFISASRCGKNQPKIEISEDFWAFRAFQPSSSAISNFQN